MAGSVKPIPDGFSAATPYLMVDDLPGAVEYYRQVFNALEYRSDFNLEGTLINVELKIGSAPVMIGGRPGTGAGSPIPSLENLPQVSIYLYVEDVDGVFNQAVAAGATVLYTPIDQFYGNRDSGIVDPFGIVWWIASRIEEISPEETLARTQAFRDAKNESPA